MNSASGTTCPDCGSSLVKGACPACALNMLLGSDTSKASPAVSSSQGEASGGVEFGRYILKRKVAAGGMGVVHEAVDQRLRRTVALKMIRGSSFADEAEVARFTIEAEAAASLDHPSIVPIYEIGQAEGQPFFTMKLIEGQSLAERLKDKTRRLSARESVELMAKIARAVHHAHQRGVLHRDLKPGNILLDKAGHPWLTDFGLAKFANAETGLTLSSDQLGTPHYMAPEIASATAKSSSIASDVWSLGVLLWELLLGRQPFQGAGPVEVMKRIVEEDPRLPSGVRVEADLLTITRKCLEKNPGRRFVSAGALADELERWLRGEPIKTRRATPQERVYKWMRRNPAIAGLYAAMTAAAVIAILLWQRAEKAVVGLTNTNDQLEYALRISMATKLAGDARMQVSEDPVRALLLAVEATEVTEHTTAGVLPEAASSLTSVLQSVGGHDVSANGTQPRQDSAYISIRWMHKSSAFVSPDSRWLVTLDWADYANSGGLAALFDLNAALDAGPVYRWHVFPTPAPDWESGPRPMLTWMPDSRGLDCVAPDGTVSRWQLIDPIDRPILQPSAKVLGKLEMPQVKMVRRLFGQHRPDRSFDVSCIWTPVDSASPQYGQISASVCHCSDQGLTWSNAVLLEGLANPVEASIRASGDGLWLFAIIREKPLLLAVDCTQPTLQLAKFSFDAPLLDVSFPVGSQEILVWDKKSRCVFLRPPKSGQNFSHEALGRTLEFDAAVLSQDTSPDGRWIAQADNTGYGSLRSFFTLAPTDGNSPMKLYLPAGACYSVKFSPDGQWLAAAGQRGTVSLWRMATVKQGAKSIDFAGLSAECMEVQFSPDSSHLIAVGSNGNARHWKLDGSSPGAQPTVVRADPGQVRHLAIAPSGTWLACACGAHEGNRTKAAGVVVVAQADGSQSRELSNHGDFATGVAFSSDGKWFASTGKDRTARVWEAAVVSAYLQNGGESPLPKFTFRMDRTRPEHVRRLAFHPSGVLYASCGDGVVFAWDLTQPDPEATQQEFVVSTIRYLLPDIAVSPNGKWLAVARHGWDRPSPGVKQFGNQVLLYDVSHPRDPVPVTELESCMLELGTLSFSPDSRWLLASGAVQPSRIWDLAASDIAASVRMAPVSSQLMGAASFSADGSIIALASHEGRLHLWDWKGAEQVRTIQCGEGLFASAFLPDGRLVAGGVAPKLYIFDTKIDRLKALARKIAQRSLTAEEIARFRVSPIQ